jgi:(E)-4-hydroxy-3-methylbut-2-enyl-diphosphate synthase
VPDPTPQPFLYRRRPTRVVSIGDVRLGGDQPLRVQSMTTPATTDTEATVAQIAALAAAGCEIVRVTVPTVTDARNLPNIRAGMRRRGVRVPLVADIHFNPAAAMAAVEHVEKVRINPGNFADSKRFDAREYTDAEYAEEIERIAERVGPLIRRARELGVAMRIGTNHGSLSDRILNRFGDTPLGMVESALEFVRLCRAEGYHDLVLSMKSSHPMVMIQAYRLLAARMAVEGMDYPFHLGVTEAGDGEDGRVKSAVGIGALLEDGIGDTVRVSLTEDPVAEIPVALALVAPYQGRPATAVRVETIPTLAVVEARDPYGYSRRVSERAVLGGAPWGGDSPPRVEVVLRSHRGGDVQREGSRAAQAVAGGDVPPEGRPDLGQVEIDSLQDLEAFLALSEALATAGVPLPLAVALAPAPVLDSPGVANRVAARAARITLSVGASSSPPAAAWVAAARSHGRPILWEVGVEGPDDVRASVETAVRLAGLAAAEGIGAQLALRVAAPMPLAGAYRLLAARLAREGMRVPLVLIAPPAVAGESPWLHAAARLGSLLCDGLGEAVRLEGLEATESARLGFTLLQGTRLRLSRAEFISCPSCGRTLFDLESTTRRIKEKTGHLKGVKIAIMGCIVNGPGEMADADFGYVGGAPGRVNLFVGKEMVARHVEAEEADARLIEIIRANGRWVEPAAAATVEPTRSLA